MSIDAKTLAGPMRQSTVAPVSARGPSRSSLLDEFEQVYRRNVDVITNYFARRCGEPQTVADLTSETFVRAAEGFVRFDARKGSDRSWVFGIAVHVFAQHCESWATGRRAADRLAGHRQLDCDEIEMLTDRIDAARAATALLPCWEALPQLDRTAIELVEIEQLTPKEAAKALGISRVAFRQRLSRARTRLRQESGNG